MNLDRITEYEESLLSDICTIYPQSISISVGVPVKTSGNGVSAPCMVCRKDTTEVDGQGVYKNVSVYMVKLPRDVSIKVLDSIVWNGLNLTVMELNNKNTLRVLTVAVCKEQAA